MNLENWSDAQIRAKFIELGHPVGPVTGTTRKVMIKKLRNLIASGAKPPTTSGEESDGGMLTPRARKKKMPPPTSVSRSPRRKSSLGRSMEPIASSTMMDPFVSRWVGDYGNAHVNDDDDSPPPSPRYPSPKLGNELFRASLNASNHFTPSPARYSSSNSYNDSNSFDRADTRSASRTSDDRPFASDFLRRLSSGRANREHYLSPGLSKKLLDVKESDDEDGGPPPNYTKFSQGRASKEAPKTTRRPPSDAWYLLDSPVSALLLVGFVLFFASIGVVYVKKTSVDSTLTSTTNLDYQLCGNSPTHIPDVNCVKEDDRTYIDLMINIVLDELNGRLLEAPCSAESIQISDNDLLNLISRKDKSLSYWVIEKNLNNLKIIFEANPKWNIKPTKEGVELTDIPQSLFCVGLSYLTLVADWVVKISVVILVVLFIFLSGRWWIRKEARHKEEVFKLVGNIIEIVSSKSQNADSYVPVSHVRDQLIPLEDREKTKRLWADALKLLETDSRLRKELKDVEGEQLVVWRWLAANLTSNKKKVWQGQAFDTVEGNLNSHVESPTNCLKIRHMFKPGQEEGDDWVTTVVDAILEKSGSAKVLHLVVDRQSAEGLVYVKCASPADAGVAYRAMHGSWFASNLVTVKYIREHRYHERFPDSMTVTKPLRPSNDYQRSLK